MRYTIKLLMALCFWAANAPMWAQEIEFTVHHAPGGPSDRVTRLLAQELPAKTYVVVNRPGAAGRIAIRHIMSRPSLMLATMPQIFVTNPIMFRDLEYDPANDLEVIAVIGIMPNVLVCNNKLALDRFVQLRDIPASLKFGVGGRGSNEHLATTALLAQWPNKHDLIFYAQGGASSLTDLIGGTIDCMFANYPLVRSFVQEGRLRVLLSSHELPGVAEHWAKTFKSPWQIQSELAIVIDRRMDAKIKQQIKHDIAQVLAVSGLESKIREAGLIPVLKHDAASLQASQRTQQRIKDFILQNQISLKE